MQEIGGVACRPISALPFAEYLAPNLDTTRRGRAVVVGVSASGGTERVVQAIETANSRDTVTRRCHREAGQRGNAGRPADNPPADADGV